MDREKIVRVAIEVSRKYRAVVIGSAAMLLHGIDTVTNDVDAVVATLPKESKVVAENLFGSCLAHHTTFFLDEVKVNLIRSIRQHRFLKAKASIIEDAYVASPTCLLLQKIVKAILYATANRLDKQTSTLWCWIPKQIADILAIYLSSHIDWREFEDYIVLCNLEPVLNAFRCVRYVPEFYTGLALATYTTSIISTAKLHEVWLDIERGVYASIERASKRIKNKQALYLHRTEQSTG